MPIANDESGDCIEVFVFVQEMHEKYEKYASAKVNLSKLCVEDKRGGGWFDLEDDCGKVLLSSKYRRVELSPMSVATLANENAAQTQGFEEVGI